MPKNKKVIVRRFFIFLIIAAFNLQTATVFAQDANTYKMLQAPFYDPGGGTCLVNVDTPLIGNDNAQKVYNFFIAKPQGLSPSQAAAILGNFQVESGMLPNRLQGQNPDGTSRFSNTVPLDGKTGYGLAQWTFLARQQALDKFAKTQNRPVYKLDLQLDFTWFEASAGSVIKTLKTINNVDVATEYWMRSYEKPQVEALQRRKDRAREFLDKFQGKGSNTTVSTSISNGVCSGVTGPGQDTKYVDGFTVYSQYDPAWANKPYGTSTIADSGCGPAAMAMILTALKNQQVTPDVTAAYADSQDQYEPGVGSKWSIATVLAEKWGLKAKPIGASIAKISAAVQAGGLVIASGQGPKPFTTGGHYIVIRAVTADGKWKIGDSANGDTSDKTWSPEQLVSNMNDGSVYAITK